MNDNFADIIKKKYPEVRGEINKILSNSSLSLEQKLKEAQRVRAENRRYFCTNESGLCESDRCYCLRV